MVTWHAFEEEAPELASFGRERIDRRVSFLATIRGEGGPRVHPVTPWIADDHLYVRMYPSSPKAADLQRDPRFALHSMMDNDDGVGGEFALNGRANRVHDLETMSLAYAAIGGPGSERPLVLFELSVDEVLTTRYVEAEPERRRWRALHAP
jgi:hypothetical protein